MDTGSPGADEPHVDQCIPLTCAGARIECGVAADGCGGTLDCGTACTSVALVSANASGGCTDVMPARIPIPVEHIEEVPPGARAVVGVGDGSGHLALGHVAEFRWHHRLVDLDGTGRGEVSGRDMHTLAPLEDGFRTVELLFDAMNAGIELVEFSADGTTRERTTIVDPVDSGLSGLSWRLATHPATGTYVSAKISPWAGNHVEYIRVWRKTEAPALEKYSMATDYTGSSDLAVLPDGSALILSTYIRYIDGLWLDTSYRYFGIDYLDLGGFVTRMLPLFDGSMALGGDDQWLGTAVAGAAPTTNVPEWLQKMGAARIEPLTSQRGYAVFIVDSESPCTQRVELRNREGELCGTLMTQSESTDCRDDAMTVTRDGTLLQLVSQTCTDSGCTVTRRWWPRLLD